MKGHALGPGIAVPLCRLKNLWLLNISNTVKAIGNTSISMIQMMGNANGYEDPEQERKVTSTVHKHRSVQVG